MGKRSSCAKRCQGFVGGGAAHDGEGIEDVGVVSRVTDERQDFAVADVHDDDCGAGRVFSPGACFIGGLQQAQNRSLQVGIDSQPEAFGNARSDFAQDANLAPVRADQGEAPAGFSRPRCGSCWLR